MITLLLNSRRNRPSNDPIIIAFIVIFFFALHVFVYTNILGIIVSIVLLFYFCDKFKKINSYNKCYDSIIKKYETFTHMNDSVRLLYNKFNKNYGFQIDELYFSLILMAYQDHLIMNISNEYKNVIIEPKSKYLNLFIDMLKSDYSYFNDIKDMTNKSEPYSYINLSQEKYDQLLTHIHFQVYKRHARIDRCLDLHIQNKQI